MARRTAGGINSHTVTSAILSVHARSPKKRRALQIRNRLVRGSAFRELQPAAPAAAHTGELRDAAYVRGTIAVKSRCSWLALTLAVGASAICHHGQVAPFGQITRRLRARIC
jgi:hypothetical protein